MPTSHVLAQGSLGRCLAGSPPRSLECGGREGRPPVGQGLQDSGGDLGAVLGKGGRQDLDNLLERGAGGGLKRWRGCSRAEPLHALVPGLVQFLPGGQQGAVSAGICHEVAERGGAARIRLGRRVLPEAALECTQASLRVHAEALRAHPCPPLQSAASISAHLGDFADAVPSHFRSGCCTDAHSAARRGTNELQGNKPQADADRVIDQGQVPRLQLPHATLQPLLVDGLDLVQQDSRVTWQA